MQLPFRFESWTAVLTALSVIAGIAGWLGGLIYNSAARDVHQDLTEKRLTSLEATTKTGDLALAQLADRLNASLLAITNLQKQNQLLADEYTRANLGTLSGRLTSLENQAADFSTKLRAASPKEEKCVELAEEADTGQRNNGGLMESGDYVTKNALATMQQLGCSSR